MARKPLDLPPEVGRRFVRDMRAFFAETDSTKQDEIAARQLHALNAYRTPSDPEIKLHHVKKLFELMMKHQPVQTAKTRKRPARKGQRGK
jgi:hypothetical protein